MKEGVVPCIKSPVIILVSRKVGLQAWVLQHLIAEWGWGGHCYGQKVG